MSFSKEIERFAALIAASMAGKICAPFLQRGDGVTLEEREVEQLTQRATEAGIIRTVINGS